MIDESQARAWLTAHFDVSRETLDRLDAFAALLRDEGRKHNLVSAASLDRLWSRHIVDSAQLIRFAPDPEASWVDLGSGAGFPGLIVAALRRGPVTLIEERRLRVEFLHRAADTLGIAVEIVGARVERVARRAFDVISARAFAPLPRLLELGSRFSTGNSIWILPKGKTAQTELEAVRPSWQGDFRLEPSLTDDAARIVVASAVKKLKGKGKA